MRETIANLRAATKLAAGACLLMALGAARIHAQAYTPPPPPLTTAPCVPTRKDPCTQPNPKPKTPAAAEANPFPGEPAAPGTAVPSAAEANPFPGEPAAPAASAPTTSDANPFPGEPPDSSGSKSRPAGGDSSSSSSSSSSDADDSPALKDEGSEGSTRFERKRLPKPGQAPEDREAEDLDVSRFYSDKGDWNAAYLRARDAVATLPSDPEAHWLLADSARHIGKADVAHTEYEAYLKLAPDGDHHAAALKALALVKLK